MDIHEQLELVKDIFARHGFGKEVVLIETHGHQGIQSIAFDEMPVERAILIIDTAHGNEPFSIISLTRNIAAEIADHHFSAGASSSQKIKGWSKVREDLDKNLAHLLTASPQPA